MMTNHLLADELFLHALCTYMNLHITVDFIGGIWTTLDIPNIKHDLAISLSDVHLTYRGFCKYGLLCKNVQLKIIGKQLMDYKTQHNQNTRITQIVLLRVEEWNTIAEKLLNEELSSFEFSKQDKYSNATGNNLDSDDMEIYDIPRYIETNIIDTDSTESYVVEEKVIGTITYSTTKLPFKCPIKSCKKKR